MKKFLAYVNYFIFWVFYFIVAKGLFLVYHHSITSELAVGEIFKVFLYGLRMDIAFTAYICIFPFFLFFISSIFKSFHPRRIIQIYTVVLVIFLSFLTVADLELYSAWGYRMDATPLQYLTSPKEMGTSVSSSPLLLLLLIFIVLAVLFIWLYKRNNPRFYFHKNKNGISIPEVLFSLFLFVFLFIPIRGGIQKIPINQSDVYFSQKIFADHAAINLPWNLTHSILNKNSDQNPFKYFSDAKAKQLVDSLYNTGQVKIPSILSTKKPNIIFIILESYTAKLVGCLGGEKGV
ncbi:MAG: hypothetical protein ABIO76_05635, partial [Ginsengibacter sp.]